MVRMVSLLLAMAVCYVFAYSPEVWLSVRLLAVAALFWLWYKLWRAVGI